MLARRPAGRLGPRYTIVWTVPAGRTTRVKQDVYPYATGGTLILHTPGSADLRQHDGPAAGTPAAPHWSPASPSSGCRRVRQRASGGGTNLTLIGGLAVLGVLAAAGVAAVARSVSSARSPSTSSTGVARGVADVDRAAALRPLDFLLELDALVVQSVAAGVELAVADAERDMHSAGRPM